MADKLPAIMFYPGDWLQDSVAGCSLAAQGLWLRMIITAHSSEPYGHLAILVKGVVNPLAPQELARRCGTTVEELMPLLEELRNANVFSEENGIIFSRRMVKDNNLREIRRAAGRKGGNPALLNQKPTTRVKQNTEYEYVNEIEDEKSKEGVQGEIRITATTIPPPIESVITHGVRIMLPEDQCRLFFDHHDARGWKSKGSKIVNWQRAMSTWASNFRSGAFAPTNGNGQAKPRDQKQLMAEAMEIYRKDHPNEQP